MVPKIVPHAGIQRHAPARQDADVTVQYTLIEPVNGHDIPGDTITPHTVRDQAN